MFVELFLDVQYIRWAACREKARTPTRKRKAERLAVCSSEYRRAEPPAWLIEAVLGDVLVFSSYYQSISFFGIFPCVFCVYVCVCSTWSCVYVYVSCVSCVLLVCALCVLRVLRVFRICCVLRVKLVHCSCLTRLEWVTQSCKTINWTIVCGQSWICLLRSANIKQLFPCIFYRYTKTRTRSYSLGLYLESLVEFGWLLF